jgi:hypothetical protein
VTGIYEVSASVRWAANATGDRTLFLSKSPGGTIAAERDLAASTIMGQTASAVVRLAAGDFVTAGVLQDSGGSLDVEKVGEQSPEFSLTWLAPGP